MGEVYRARDTRLDRVVAIKILFSEKVKDDDRKRRFLREARTVSSLNHPNIVQLYDIVSVNEGEVLVLEYVPGRVLATDKIANRSKFGITMPTGVDRLTSI